MKSLTDGDKAAIRFLSKMTRKDFAVSDCVAERCGSKNPYRLDVPETASGWNRRLKHLAAGGLVKEILPGSYCYELTQEARREVQQP